MRVSLNLGFSPAVRLALIAIVALSTGCSAVARDNQTWRCDAPNGSYDHVTPRIWNKTTSISGRITFHKAYFGPHWSSTARIAFTDSNLKDSECRCNGIFVKAFPGHSNVGLYMLVDGEAIDLAQAPLGEPIDFEFSIDEQGQLTAKVGKTPAVTKTGEVSHPERDTMLISCSGADVSFLNVDPQ